MLNLLYGLVCAVPSSVQELQSSLGLPAAASFKHVSPAGKDAC